MTISDSIVLYLQIYHLNYQRNRTKCLSSSMSSKSYTHVKMPNLLNHLYNGNGAISPELVEAQPHLVKNVLKGRRPVSKVKPSKSHSNEGLATEYVLLFSVLDAFYDPRPNSAKGQYHRIGGCGNAFGCITAK